jgi:hypothetical protein
MGNGGPQHTENISAHRHSISLALTIPPLSTLLFRWK